ncbi:MAG: hypothetical protein FJ312_05655 [SAR202 cluster bacterium]|nr:hypothetical protein [SAR202 cluster bacterium]
MSARTTLAPSLANSRASAAPMPLAAPVIRATFPSNLPIVLLISFPTSRRCQHPATAGSVPTVNPRVKSLSRAESKEKLGLKWGRQPGKAYESVTRQPHVESLGGEERDKLHSGQAAGLAGQSDEELIALVVEQKREALEALYRRYGNAVYSLALHILRDPGAAEEMAQDSFFNVWRGAATAGGRWCRGMAPQGAGGDDEAVAGDGRNLRGRCRGRAGRRRRGLAQRAGQRCRQRQPGLGPEG